MTVRTTQENGTTPIRLAVIGAGVISQQHIEGARDCETVEVVGLADIVPGLARSVADRHGIGWATTDPSELITSDDVDAVVLALPTGPRQELALAAIDEGKHVLLEKPTAASAADVQRLLDARGSAVVAGCSGRFRTRPVARRIADLVSSGRLGAVRELHLRGLRPAPPRPQTPPPAWRLNRRANGGGILWNWGPYDLDFLLGSVGWSFVPRTAFGKTWRVPESLTDWVAPGSDAESHAVGLVLGEGDTVLSIDRGEYLPVERSVCEIIGTEGSVSVDYSGGSGSELVVTVIDDTGARVVEREQQTDTYADIPGALIGDFADAILHGRPPLTTLENALVISRITDAVRESGESGQAVRID